MNFARLCRALIFAGLAAVAAHGFFTQLVTPQKPAPPVAQLTEPQILLNEEVIQNLVNNQANSWPNTIRNRARARAAENTRVDDPSVPEPKADRDMRISGPYTYKNLEFFLIHGEDRIPGKTYMTLAEGLEAKQVVVHETGNVNNLAIENTSGEEVFIQAGEIIQGGKQDRVLAMDLILSPKSGKVPIASFCVEQGRWAKRGGESVHKFSKSNNAIHSSALKKAALTSKSQQEVWKHVKESQGKLRKRLAGQTGAVTEITEALEVIDNSTSLQLSLETGAIKKMVKEYMEAFEVINKSKKDTIGYAFSINGKMNSADVYVSHALFNKLWKKMAKAACTEAVSELVEGESHKKVTLDDAKTFMKNLGKNRKAVEKNSKRILRLTYESDGVFSSKTVDKDNGNISVHDQAFGR